VRSTLKTSGRRRGYFRLQTGDQERHAADQQHREKTDDRKKKPISRRRMSLSQLSAWRNR
jgi:hypothetical protein